MGVSFNIRLFYLPFIACCLLLASCSTAYYGAMEKMGVHKRDILADRVVESREAQTEAQEQFKSALEQFAAVVELKDTNLKKAYEKLNKEYEDSEQAAEEVSDRIDAVESVADALFDEWQDELELYESKELRRSSKQQLSDTKSRYKEMLYAMHQAEKSMDPVLRTFRDNVLFLKHNLNAQAIGSLKGEFSKLENQIDLLIGEMNQAIATSDKFIVDLKK
ncbi:MAG: DUF2959 domain-containing protein [Thermodesulfobacteriota bacterium]